MPRLGRIGARGQGVEQDNQFWDKTLDQANPDAAQFLAYLRGPEAVGIFARAGFDVPAVPPR